MADDQDEIDLVDEMVQLTGSDQSRRFYRMMIKRHGYEPVRSECGELRTLLQTKAGTPDAIQNPGAFLTKLLTDLDFSDPEPYKGKPKHHFFESLEEHVQSLAITPIKADDVIEYSAAMPAPYSGQGIPWPTAIGPEFFTLSTNKAKSDIVMTSLRTSFDQTVEVPLARGKGFPSDLEWGIATAEDSRIVKALIIMWQEDGCKTTDGRVKKCWVKFAIRKLARTMGYTNFGGKNLKYLAQRLSRLGSIMYYLDLAGLPGFKNDTDTRTIYFIDKPSVAESGSGKRKEMFFIVTFSEFLSRTLYRRKTITRHRDLVLQTNEIALLFQDYIESRAKDEEENKKGFVIGLSTLIEKLFLPPAAWHKYKSKRLQNFDKAIKELNGSTTWDGDAFFASLEEKRDGSDFMVRVKRCNILDAPELPFAENTHTSKSHRYYVARERAMNSYVGKFDRGMGNLALVLRQYAALRRATDPQ